MTDDPGLPADLEQRLRAVARALVPSEELRDVVLRDVGAGGRPEETRGRRPWLLAVAATAVVGVGLGLVQRGQARTGEARDPATSEPEAQRPTADGAEDEAVVRERRANLALYRQERARLHREAKGKWVLIADRDPATVVGSFKPVVLGESPESLAPLAVEARHRFVFRVGDEGDRESTGASWHAARFAGPALVQALGVTSKPLADGGGVELRRGDAQVTFGFSSKFPRLLLGIEGCGSSMEAPDRREVLLAAAGPTLVLAPQDVARLDLARWEVPGVETVEGVACRRVLVRVQVPDLEVDVPLVAAVPDLPLSRRVESARVRNRFWEPAGTSLEALDLPWLGDARGHWIVYGNDRVLGVGATTEAALEAADALRDPVHQRYLMQWPPEEALVLDAADFSTPTSVYVDGRELKGVTRPADASVLRVRAESSLLAVGYGLRLAESGRDVLLRQGDGAPLRTYAAYARASDAPSGRGPSRVLLVVAVP